MVALLRAVNVGGRTLPMADLRALAGDLGFRDVETYLQSGNLLFTPARALRPATAARRLEAAVAERSGLDVTVIVRTVEELQAIVAGNPLQGPRVTESELHVTFLAEQPAAGAVRAIPTDAGGRDTFVVTNCEVFVRCRDGYGRTKINNSFFERRLGVRATTRNWKTVTTLARG
jgi:uncharacterized protein (DUF1697 family)